MVAIAPKPIRCSPAGLAWPYNGEVWDAPSAAKAKRRVMVRWDNIEQAALEITLRVELLRLFGPPLRPLPNSQPVRLVPIFIAMPSS
jgi:hypothetical protein